jgi:hypothetical protein
MPPLNCRAPLAGDSVDRSRSPHLNCNSSGKHRHFAFRFRAKCIREPDTYCDGHRPTARKSFDCGCCSAARARDCCHTEHQGAGCQRARNSALGVVDWVTAAIETAMVAQRWFWILERRREGSDYCHWKAVANADFDDGLSSTARHRLARTGSSRTRSACSYDRRQLRHRVGARPSTNGHHSGEDLAGRRFPESIQLTIVTAAEPDASYCR